MHTGGRRRGRPFGVPETRMVLFHFAALAPLAITAWSLAQGTLGPDLVSTLGRRSGRYALVFLLLSLVPSLLARLPRLAWVARLRRPLGLYTFGYAVLHLFTFVGLDYAFDWPLLLAAIRQDRFVLLGLAALLLLLPLALTSTDGWVRRLGRRWRRLHRLVYLAAALVVVHYAWAFKELRPAPVLAGVVLGVLLAIRLALWLRRRRVA